MAHLKIFGQPDERTLEQLERCTVDADFGVLCADSHVGYSMPIGGAAAYEDQVSPSGVGFDIGCLVAGSRITTTNGYSLAIEEVEACSSAACFDGGAVRRIDPAYCAIPRGVRRVCRLQLANGRKIHLTPDHRVLTRRGWVEAERLDAADAVACVPFLGLPFEPFPVSSALIRLLAYMNGDGHLSRDGKTVSIYTTSEADAAAVSRDLVALGFRPRTYRRVRVPTRPAEIHVRVGSKELHQRLVALGAPVGKKIWDRDILTWLFESPAWVRGHYLSAFASAEMSTPRLLDGSAPNLALKQSGRRAAEIVAELFESLKFETSVMRSGPRARERQIYVVQLLGGADAQLRFFEQIGFCYAASKRTASARVASVLWQRGALVARREAAQLAARRLHARAVEDRVAMGAISAAYDVSPGFAYHAMYSGRGRPRRGPRVEFHPETFGEAVWTRVAEISDADRAEVWDLATGDSAASFLASGVVVHNCGNKAARTPLRADDVDVPRVMDDIARQISFGIGRSSGWRVDDPVLDKIERAPFSPQRKLAKLAREQLGTVGGGNHYVDLLVDEEGFLWIGVHFGSRGFGHKTATGFFALAQGLQFEDRAKEGPMDSPPVLFDTRTDLGQSYIEAMNLAAEYAHAGRDLVVDRVLGILGTHPTEEVHNHHNMAWHESHFGKDYWVVRKGCTPAFPRQVGFVGGSMGDISVILEGVDGQEAREALHSTVHGAGRVMSRRQAAGRRRWVRDKRTGRRVAKTISPGVIDWEQVKRELRKRGIELRGGGADEAPGVYKRLEDVLDAHKGSIRIRHTLRPLGVAMAGDDVEDPYKD